VTSPYTPQWLDPADVKAWLKTHAGLDPADDALVAACCAAVEPQVQRSRPDQYPTVNPLARGGGRVVGGLLAAAPYTPDAEVYQAAVMLAAGLFRRRNSVGGKETFGQSLVVSVSQSDPDIGRALRWPPWHVPGVA